MQDFRTKSNQVFDMMDDWIVASVQKENSHVQRLAKQLQDVINGDELILDHGSFSLPELNLYADIDEIVDFKEQIDLPMTVDVKRPEDRRDYRFKINWLEFLFSQMAKSAFNEYIEINSFLHILLVAVRDHMTPEVWRWIDFSKFNECALNFKVEPSQVPIASKEDPGKELLFKEDTHKWEVENSQTYVNWKEIMVYFILLHSRLPSKENFESMFKVA
jgi:hypothetical protein